jgi:outer membrane lipoprotein carrier protein
MKKASLLIIPALLLQFVLVNAQVDKKAKDLLDKVSAKTKSFTTYKINFSFTLHNPDLKINETTSGTLEVKGPKYHLKMGEQEIFCDGKNVISYQKETNEALSQDIADMDSESITPQSIFMMYEKGFKIRYVKDATEGSKKIAVIDLYPIEPKKKDYSMITLFVDDLQQSINRAEIKAKNGSKYTYAVNKLEPNVTMADNSFTFDKAKYPGVKVIK